jgi:hypothetical protein
MGPTRYVILFRNIWTKKIGFVSNETGEMAQWSTRGEAERAALLVPILEAAPYRIVEVEV